MRISDWSSDLCSSDLASQFQGPCLPASKTPSRRLKRTSLAASRGNRTTHPRYAAHPPSSRAVPRRASQEECRHDGRSRSEEHTSELQSLMRISYAVLCEKKKKKNNIHDTKMRV